MPLNLQIPYQAPAFTAQGFQGLASGIQDFFQKQEAARKEAEQLQYENVKNQTIMQNLAQHKLITPEQMLEFQNAPPKKQKALAEGQAANVAFNLMQQKQGQADISQRIQDAGRVANTNLDITRNNQMVSPPAPKPFKIGEQTIGFTDAKGELRILPSAILQGQNGEAGSPVDPLMDPNTKQAVPGMGIIRKTGQAVSTSSGIPELVLDASKNFYLDAHSKSWKPINAATALTMQSAGKAPSPPDLTFWDAIKQRVAGPTVETPTSKKPATGITPSISTQAEYDAVAPGSNYLDARDGKIKTKQQ